MLSCESAVAYRRPTHAPGVSRAPPPARIPFLILLTIAVGTTGCGSKTEPSASVPSKAQPEEPKAQPEEPKKAPSPTEPAPKPSTPPVNDKQKPSQPTEPKTANPLGSKIVTIDLMPFGIRAVIDVPEGGFVRRYESKVMIGYGGQNPDVKEWKEYELSIERTNLDRSLAIADQTGAKDAAEGSETTKVLEFAPDRYFTVVSVKMRT